VHHYELLNELVSDKFMFLCQQLYLFIVYWSMLLNSCTQY